MPNTGPMEDRLLIRELFGLYGDASCKGDGEAWLDLFAQDCEWNSHMFNRKGKADLREQWDQLWAAFDKLGFLSEIGWIAVDGDTARASSQAREIIRLKDGNLFKLIGHYDDYLVRENGQWLFARRNYQPLVEEAPGS
jgi:ketosteroid isomerase-like protein